MNLKIILACIYTILLAILLLTDKSHFSKNFLEKLEKVYFGFNSRTVKGIFIGLIWAFIDGYVTGLVIEWILK